jgi:hypothetical protein
MLNRRVVDTPVHDKALLELYNQPNVSDGVRAIASVPHEKIRLRTAKQP